MRTLRANHFIQADATLWRGLIQALDVVGLFDVMTFRHWIRIIGIALIGFGLLCLPSIESSPQSHGSGFTILSDTGFLLWIAIILIVPTWLLIVRPCKEMIVRKRERDDYANHLTNR